MKAKILYLFETLCALALLAGAVLCLLCDMIWLFALLFVVGLALAFSLVGLLSFTRFMKQRVIDPKRHTRRNYDKLVLGEMDGSKTEANALDLRGYKRNAYTDKLLAERYYSFLSDQGVVEIRGNKVKYYSQSNKISALDYLLLHPVTLTEHGINNKSRTFLAFNPIIGAKFLGLVIKSKFIKRKKLTDDTKFEDLKAFLELRTRKFEIK